MGYADFSKAYLDWIKTQLDYVNESKPYTNFKVTGIDPKFEINGFRTSSSVEQQKTYHNAADDQVGFMRCIREMEKSPSDYLQDYADYLIYEQGNIQAIATSVDNIHNNQNNTEDNTASFNAIFAPAVIGTFSEYNPTRIFATS
jgi:hypothetical protein